MFILNPALCWGQLRGGEGRFRTSHRAPYLITGSERPLREAWGSGGKWKRSYGSQPPIGLPPLFVSLPHPSPASCPRCLWLPLASQVPCHCYLSSEVPPSPPMAQPPPCVSLFLPWVLGKAPPPVVCISATATCCPTGVVLHWPQLLGKLQRLLSGFHC